MFVKISHCNNNLLQLLFLSYIQFQIIIKTKISQEIYWLRKLTLDNSLINIRRAYQNRYIFFICELFI